jgi:serine carboxypeptidase-like clade 2
MKVLKLIIPLILIKYIFSFPEEDKVTSLPDYSYTGELYSGYLNVSEIKKFHYMFNIAPDSANKPLVLWLNGGPGCSSLDGWANEHGPMMLDEEGHFKLNDYSWVNAANMIYLESPGGVGFSYINSTAQEDLYVDDNTTAKDNLQALLSFFEKFPEMKEKDFYISGESYGGIYVPILAYEVIEYNKEVEEVKKIKLKGILVGNGVTDWKYDTEFAMMDFIFTHHLTSYEHRLDYVKYCLTNKTFDEGKCNETYDVAYEILNGINMYDYLRECKTPKNLKGEISTKSKYYQYAPWAFKRQKTTNEELLNLIEDGDEGEAVPCFDDTNIENFFSRSDVQSALHVINLKNWYVCSSSVFSNYTRLDEGSIWTYQTLIKEGLRILIYCGDTDAVVPYNGNQLWIRDLKLETLEPWRNWRVDNDPDNVAGYVVKYKGLTFCTIKGTGHMAPGWKPKESFYMFSQFLKDQDF